MFMDLILMDEIARGGSGGVIASWFLANNIALPQILAHGSPELKDEICRAVITGKKTIALAVTEPWGGSDVARLRCTATRDGDFYVVNGEKKFITAGMKASWLTTAVRTDPKAKGMGGISVLAIDTKLPGVTIRRQKTQGWWCSSTTYITFENVRVPVDHLIGKEGMGFKYVMENFNHERFAAIVFTTRGCRSMIEESIRFARVRETFGKKLIENQVIRHKIANMAMQTEAVYAMAEQIAYHMEQKAPHAEVGPKIALAKVMATRTFEMCAREASQILGGNSFVRGGHGERIERLYREVRVAAIGGGSEEIMIDFIMRMSKL
jgi:alkylation response protein AidB-like acyl-CoA dehydrogenase